MQHELAGGESSKEMRKVSWQAMRGIAACVRGSTDETLAGILQVPLTPKE